MAIDYSALAIAHSTFDHSPFVILILHSSFIIPIGPFAQLPCIAIYLKEDNPIHDHPKSDAKRHSRRSILSLMEHREVYGYELSTRWKTAG